MSILQTVFAIVLSVFLASPSLVWGQGGRTPMLGGSMRGLTEIQGTLICTNCSIAEAKRAEGESLDFYLLERGQEQAVIQVSEVHNTTSGRDGVIGGRWEAVVGLTNELAIRAEERLWQKLTAAENLKKPVMLRGILHSTKTFDLTEVFVEG